MKKIAKKHILGIRPYRPGKPIAEVQRELGLRQVIKLASNESPLGPSPRVYQAILKEARNVNRYPDDGCFYLRRELARRLRVSAPQLIFGNGSDEIIHMTTRAFADKNDEVVVARPSFLIYSIAPQMEGAKIRAVPLRDLRYDLDGMAAAVTRRTKIIFIGNPDNPAGTYIPEQDLKRFLKRVRRDIIIFIDEAYGPFVRGGDFPDALKLLRTYPNIIVARTFSKMFGLAGLRIGYGVARPETIAILNRVRAPFNVNSLAQAAALACLKDQGYYRRVIRMVEEERRFLYRAFEKMGVAYYKSATNFILIDVGANASRVCRRMLRRGVIVRDMKDWGVDNLVRVTIGTRSENQKLLKVLKQVL